MSKSKVDAGLHWLPKTTCLKDPEKILINRVCTKTPQAVVGSSLSRRSGGVVLSSRSQTENAKP